MYFILGGGHLFGLIPRNKCCPPANRICLLGVFNGLLIFAILKKTVDAVLHPDGPR